MDNSIKSVFRFDGYVVKNMMFMLNDECNGHEFNIDFDMDHEMKSSIKENNYIGNLSVDVSVFKDAKKNNYPFELNITVEGRFSAMVDGDKCSFMKRMEQNGLAILFPYIRSIVSDASKMANMTPLLLPSINIVKFLKKKEKYKS